MSCTDFDVRDYFLGELAEADRVAAARHLQNCPDCSGSLSELQHLRFALESVSDQDPPQRIGFVSDKIFEPSRARRVWSSFWNSAPRLGFASAALLSGALLFFAIHPVREIRVVERPLPVVADIKPQIDEAVRKAVAETEARQQQRTEVLISAVQHKYEKNQRELMLRVADTFDNTFNLQRKRALVHRASMFTNGGDPQ